SEALSADVAARAVIAGELAAPRATGKIMAVLPLCGLGMGYLLGGDPGGYLLSSPWGWGCLVGGVTLAAAGVLWIDKLARLDDEQG
ncbi:MAG TPA: type II secretion system protein, partial [Propionibacteriaceae bacterium]